MKAAVLIDLISAAALIRAAALISAAASASAVASADAFASEAAPAAPSEWTAPIRCPLSAAGWVQAPFEGRRANQISCRDGTLRLRSRRSISLHYVTPPAALRRARSLSWEWRVSTSGGASDLTKKGADDRDLAVLVAFRHNPDHASAMERLTRPMVEARSGADAPGRVIAYTWAGGDPGAAEAPGARALRSPFGGRAHRIRVLRRGAGPWRGESIDLAADHQRLFGRSRYEIQYLAVASDTDDLGGAAEAEIRALRLRLGAATSH